DARDDIARGGRPDRTARQPSQREGSAHHGQELPPADGIGPDRGLRRKFIRHEPQKFVRFAELLEAPPETAPAPALLALQGGEFRIEVFAAAHRWHTEQLVSVLESGMPYSSRSSA